MRELAVQALRLFKIFCLSLFEKRGQKGMEGPQGYNSNPALVLGDGNSVRRKHPCRGGSSLSSPEGMHNLAVGNAHGSDQKPKETTDPEGSHARGVRGGATISGLAPARGSGTRRALPDAMLCRPFRAETLPNSGLHLL